MAGEHRTPPEMNPAIWVWLLLGSTAALCANVVKITLTYPDVPRAYIIGAVSALICFCISAWKVTRS